MRNMLDTGSFTEKEHHPSNTVERADERTYFYSRKDKWNKDKNDIKDDA